MDTQFETRTHTCLHTHTHSQTHMHACQQASRHFGIFAWSERGVWHVVGKTSPSASWINRQTEGFDFQNNFIYTVVIIHQVCETMKMYSFYEIGLICWAIKSLNFFHNKTTKITFAAFLFPLPSRPSHSSFNCFI